MKKVFIDGRLISPQNSSSKNLITCLRKLYAKNFRIFSDSEPNQNLLEILKNEGIELSIIDSCSEGFTKLLFANGVSVSGLDSLPDKSFAMLEDGINYIVKSVRFAKISRITNETKISVSVLLDGSGDCKVSTGVGFFDHMLEQIARHGNIDLVVETDGDLHVDEHHTIEDTGIALGEAILKALGKKKGIKRYGFFLPMDDAHARCALDLGGRTFLNFKCKFNREKVGEFPTELTEEFFRALAGGMKANLLLRAKGNNDHHKIEALFKAFAKSLNEACRLDERAKNKLPTTKGTL